MKERGEGYIQLNKNQRKEENVTLTWNAIINLSFLSGKMELDIILPFRKSIHFKLTIHHDANENAVNCMTILHGIRVYETKKRGVELGK